MIVVSSSGSAFSSFIPICFSSLPKLDISALQEQTLLLGANNGAQNLHPEFCGYNPLIFGCGGLCAAHFVCPVCPSVGQSQVKMPETDGYAAVQVTFGIRRASRVPGQDDVVHAAYLRCHVLLLPGGFGALLGGE
jgi:hypothetical protein